MLNLQWVTEDRLPTPQELDELNIVLAQAVVNMKQLHSVDARTAFYALLIFEFLMTVFEEGVRRVQEAMKKLAEEDPVTALMMMLMGR